MGYSATHKMEIAIQLKEFVKTILMHAMAMGFVQEMEIANAAIISMGLIVLHRSLKSQ